MVARRRMPLLMTHNHTLPGPLSEGNAPESVEMWARGAGLVRFADVALRDRRSRAVEWQS